MMVRRQSHVLMIGSNARKSGKTTLICRLLNTYGKRYSIVAIKTALYDDKHKFRIHYPMAMNLDYLEIGEKGTISNKDSGKYLKSGADESWFLASTMENVYSVVEKIGKLSQNGKFMVLESTTLRKYIVPEAMVMLYQHNGEQKDRDLKVASYADLWVKTGSEAFNNIENYIQIQNNTWKLRADI